MFSQVLYYRECRTINKFELATVTEDGVDVEGPFSVETNWEIAKYVKYVCLHAPQILYLSCENVATEQMTLC